MELYYCNPKTPKGQRYPGIKYSLGRLEDFNPKYWKNIVCIFKLKSYKMEALFREVYEIALRDPGTLAEHSSKLGEESGEFARAVNMLIGRKNRKDRTEKEIKENLAEEFADVIQVMASIAAKSGVSYEDVCIAFEKKNKSYNKFVSKLNHDLQDIHTGS